MLKRLILLCVLGFGSWMAFRLWQKGELNKDIDWETVKSEGLSMGGELKGKGLELKSRWDAEGWDTLKASLEKSLSWGEVELRKFKKDLPFLQKDSSIVNVEEAKSRLELEDVEVPDEIPDEIFAVDPKPESPKDISLSRTSRKASVVARHEPEEAPVAKQDSVAMQVLAPSSEPSSIEQQGAVYPILEKSRSYVKAMDMLQKAKEEMKQGMPDQAHHQRHLKRAVYLYKKCRDELSRLQKIRGLNDRETEHLDSLMTEVQKQIYWGSKLGSL